MREELLAFGWRPGSLLTVISDGELALSNLIRNAIDGDGLVKHIVDWWYTSMRVRHVEAAVQGLVQARGFIGNPVLFQRPAKSLRCWLWHGKARVAVNYLKWLKHDCVSFAEEPQDVRAPAGTLRDPVHLSCEQHGIPSGLWPTGPYWAADLIIAGRRISR